MFGPEEQEETASRGRGCVRQPRQRHTPNTRAAERTRARAGVGRAAGGGRGGPQPEVGHEARVTCRPDQRDAARCGQSAVRCVHLCICARAQLVVTQHIQKEPVLPCIRRHLRGNTD